MSGIPPFAQPAKPAQPAAPEPSIPPGILAAAHEAAVRAGYEEPAVSPIETDPNGRLVADRPSVLRAPPVYGWDSDDPAARPGGQVLGFYTGPNTPHDWTAAEIEASGAEGAYAIFVPDQNEAWWKFGKGGATYLRDLVGASDLVLPELCPGELDIEEGQAEEMGPTVLAQVGQAWLDLCLNKPVRLRLIPWLYGGELTQACMPNGIRKHLALWNQPAGQKPLVPPTSPAPGYAGWQYAGNVPVAGGLADLDVFAQGYRFATLDLSTTIVIGPRAGRIPTA